MDSSGRSGHGRVVYLYCELYEKIWGGSPATEQIDTGLETVDFNVSSLEPTDTSPTCSLENMGVNDDLDKENEESAAINDHQSFNQQSEYNE